jgi:hypothetical protein
MLDEELQNIERAVRRVEHSNDERSREVPTGVVVTSVTSGLQSADGFTLPKATRMVELIQEYSDLTSTIEFLSTKPVAVRVDFPTDDFPRETAERLEVISRCDQYAQALAVKDQMLWTALQEKTQLESSLEDETQLCHEYALEVSKWAEIAQGLNAQLAHMKQQVGLVAEKNNRLTGILREHDIYYHDDAGRSLDST